MGQLCTKDDAATPPRSSTRTYIPATTAAASRPKQAPAPVVAVATEPPVNEPDAKEREKFVTGEWRMKIPRDIKIDELLRLLETYNNYPNVRWPAKPEKVYVDKIVMAIRGCSSVVKKRQDAAVASGVVGPLVKVLTGVHLKDRESCLRTVQCILGICGNNEAAIEAFKVAGASRAMNTIMIQCKDTSNRKFKDSNSNDFAKAAEMFA